MRDKCPKCDNSHSLYYLIKRNNTRAMFMLCGKMKSRGLPFTIFVPLKEGGDMPTYLTDSRAYAELKASCQTDGEFTDADRAIITKWKSGRLGPKYMTKEQIEMIKRYCLGSIRW